MSRNKDKQSLMVIVAINFPKLLFCSILKRITKYFTLKNYKNIHWLMFKTQMYNFLGKL